MISNICNGDGTITETGENTKINLKMFSNPVGEASRFTWAVFLIIWRFSKAGGSSNSDWASNWNEADTQSWVSGGGQSDATTPTSRAPKTSAGNVVLCQGDKTLLRIVISSSIKVLAFNESVKYQPSPLFRLWSYDRLVSPRHEYCE